MEWSLLYLTVAILFEFNNYIINYKWMGENNKGEIILINNEFLQNKFEETH